ncbi:tRNA threonylcarbamoyladenosine biosynthesis protein [Bacillus sp. FJAT-18017]|uniref:L-threonylcarbamoyladenylate synthase n=1 Tax=Bacillus sp. FJAT-18017 TaxID=1705566 RepID=UPI0006AE18CB|nr:L-threonylcarbamoyladenylate synthase [Bacillus sp. FJAT-18017]ALC88696.1 tRNA threonylcarbamoyladenosine biosynthesis protein [Bacillus sp. FJAT-18017]
MDTIIWTVDNVLEDLDKIKQAAALLEANEAVAFPTETVYGLGGNAESDDAVEKIFQAKGRPSDNPLIIHIADKIQMKRFVADLPEVAEKLIEAFWPGPLTLILHKKEGVLSEKATAGLGTVGVRMPDHPVALAILKESALPIAAPSANSSGKPSPTTARHVADDLNGRIAGILDGGTTGVGVESTVLDCTSPIPAILRPGGITFEQLEAVIGKVEIDPALRSEDSKPKAPGMKYRHYAPEAPLYLVDGNREFLQAAAANYIQDGKRVGILATEETAGGYDANIVLACGRRDNLETVAAALYDTLRIFNEHELDIILSETFPEAGVGHAIMNRLMKAAGNKVIHE